jgi:hypothetical protein
MKGRVFTWRRLRERVRLQRGHARGNISVICRLQGMLGYAKDTPEHSARLHLSIEQTKTSAQDTRALLHRIGSMFGNQDTGDGSQRHEQRKLGDDLQRVLKSFRDTATESLTRERSTCAAAKEHAWSVLG